MEVPSITKVAVGEEEPMPTLPVDLTMSRDWLVEETMAKGSKEVEPWT